MHRFYEILLKIHSFFVTLKNTVKPWQTVREPVWEVLRGSRPLRVFPAAPQGKRALSENFRMRTKPLWKEAKQGAKRCFYCFARRSRYFVGVMCSSRLNTL